MPQLNKLVPQRTHKERHQPFHRKNKGLLEKKKDYKERALNFQKKRDYIKKLQEKAAFKNPDEFTFAMEKTKRVNGEHQSLASAEVDPNMTKDQQVNLFNQDLSYLAYKRNVEAKKIEKLRETLHFIDEDKSEKRKRKHIVFVDDEEEAEKFNEAEYFETEPRYLKRSFNRPTKETLETKSLMVNEDELTPDQIKKLDSQRSDTYRELRQRLLRHRELTKAYNKIYIKKQKVLDPNHHKRKRTNGSNNNSGPTPVIWKQQRKK
eukprot:TRINITY_DN2885_c0_g1_i1.p1 TRINITY_DN2885_c0_g1~~TRINITY_DN2885_c0_g1_i1.p1  ORF type:complete len:263 (-),score=63.95 TRINITY_DN2885_c0_g1_i1:101-889(-)